MNDKLPIVEEIKTLEGCLSLPCVEECLGKTVAFKLEVLRAMTITGEPLAAVAQRHGRVNQAAYNLRDKFTPILERAIKS